MGSRLFASREPITAIIPAYNEAGSIAETIRSLQAQSWPIADIIVVDDQSTDGTGDIARELGATVIRPTANTGSKAGAQSFALPFVRSRFCMAIDADTTLAPDAVEQIVAPLIADHDVAAACGFVVPRYVRSIWERGRYIEYLFAFTYYKPVQEIVGRPLISSGCFSAYRTEVLRQVGGWSTRTLAEDMDLTWTLYAAGWKVRFVEEAICYPIEPHDFHFLARQLKRWSHGFVQNLSQHWREVVQQPCLGPIVAVCLWDALVSGLVFLLVLPLLTIFIHPLFLAVYLIDLPAVAVPVLLKGMERGEVGRVLASIPCFFVLRLVNSFFMLRAAWDEWVAGRTLLTYEKGH